MRQLLPTAGCGLGFGCGGGDGRGGGGTNCFKNISTRRFFFISASVVAGANLRNWLPKPCALALARIPVIIGIPPSSSIN
jgi:hypothetical protein